MNEREWVASVVDLLSENLQAEFASLVVSQGAKLAYAYEIQEYSAQQPGKPNIAAYETDILITEELGKDTWKPRVVIEAKLSSVTTHDAITYSEKAATHKNVHPYLRYGIILGNRKHYPLPGRLFRHGAYFDFMLSWAACDPTPTELKYLFDLVTDEVKASQDLEEILYSSRSPNRKRYTLLHRPLRLE
jgi:hypothetical protein